MKNLTVKEEAALVYFVKYLEKRHQAWADSWGNKEIIAEANALFKQRVEELIPFVCEED